MSDTNEEIATRVKNLEHSVLKLCQEDLAKAIAQQVAEHLQLVQLHQILKSISEGTYPLKSPGTYPLKSPVSSPREHPSQCKILCPDGQPPAIHCLSWSRAEERNRLCEVVLGDSARQSFPHGSQIRPKPCGDPESPPRSESDDPTKEVNPELTEGDSPPESMMEMRNPGTITSSKTRDTRKSVLKSESHEFGDSPRARLSKWLDSWWFDSLISALILTNTFILCWESQYNGLDVGKQLNYPGRKVQAHKVWRGADTTWKIFDWFFGILFLLELLVKVAAWGLKYIYNTEGIDPALVKPRWLIHFWAIQGWNLLDFFCVVAFIISRIVQDTLVNPQMIRMLRLVRVWRLVRLLRAIETMDHLYIMTTALSGLKKVLLWAIILLTTMLLTCDLVLVQVLHATYFDDINLDDLTPDQIQAHHEIYRYFGTCTRCLLSMFEITLGNWPPVARMLSEEVSEWFMLCCLAHKLTVGFAFIGVITGVILQETFRVAQTDDVIMYRQKLKAKTTLRSKMAHLFEVLDEEHDGRLAEEEFRAIGESLEIQTWLASLDIETDDLGTLFALIDIEGKGYITLDQLVTRIPRIKGAARSIDVITMRRQAESNNRELTMSC